MPTTTTVPIAHNGPTHHGSSLNPSSRGVNQPPPTSGSAEQQKLNAVEHEVQAVGDLAEHVTDEREQLHDLQHGGLLGLGAGEGSPFGMELGFRHWLAYHSWLVWLVLIVAAWVAALAG